MNKNACGIGFTGALTLIFIVLKLTDNITWSWLWVLCPLWIPFAAFAIAILCIYISSLFR
ncbi:MAG: hypothetical protein HUJ88_11575 [Fusobacterium necrophorum]|nr:hypothetical protein [Fusobacterium necrophorum]